MILLILSLGKEFRYQNKMSPQYPQTVKEAVATLNAEMKEKERLLLTSTPEDKLILLHHSFGRHIRNSFGLWTGNVELMRDTGEAHPDDASMVIIKALWTKLREG